MSSLEDRERSPRRDWHPPIHPLLLAILMFLMVVEAMTLVMLVAAFAITGDWLIGLLTLLAGHFIAKEWTQ